MSYGYGRPNPFDQRDPSPGGGGGYGGPAGGPPGGSYGQGPSPYGNNGGNNMEMSSYPAGGSSSQGGYGGAPTGDPNAILNECRDIDRGIDTVERNLEQLRMLQQRSLDDADSSANSMTNRQLDQLSSETMDLYRSLTDRVRKVKSDPESRQPKNAPQVNRIDRRLKQAINQYQQVESGFRKKNQDQMARQYRIVRPNADEQEVREAVEDTSGGQVFSQALMQSSRLGSAQRALSAVQDRHVQIQKIERQMVELAQLFQDMDTLVVQQEVAVAQISQKAEEVADNLDKGNEEIQTAVTTARATRRKKWWCLGIVIAIIVVVVAVVIIYLAVTGQLGGGGGDNNDDNNNSQRRSLSMTIDPNGHIALSKTIPSWSRSMSRVVRRSLRDTAGAVPVTARFDNTDRIGNPVVREVI